MIIDNQFMTVGSANLNHRSMRIDSEMNLSFESEGERSIENFISITLCRLLAEHLGIREEEFRAEFLKQKSLLNSLNIFKGKFQRTLKDIPLVYPTFKDRAYLLMTPFVDIRFSLPKIHFLFFILSLLMMSFMFEQDVH
jgi:phosphatidylserine/phosphatidylglycerophosphate/cardiolipin synthase-like enzyme